MAWSTAPESEVSSECRRLSKPRFIAGEVGLDVGQGVFDMAGFEPKILAFLCTWCAYAGADLAGVSRLQYPANVRNIRVMCSATISPHHILKAFQKGADGVFVGG